MKKQLSPAPLDKVKALIRAGRHAEAERALLALKAQRPRDVAVLVCLAQVQSRYLKAHQAAVGTVEALLKLAPGVAAVQQEAAEAFAHVRRFDRAVDHAERALALAPRDADVLHVAGVVYQEAGRPEDAVRCLTSALAIRPDHLPSQLVMARNLRAMGEMDAARALCLKILARHPDNDIALSLYARTGRFTAEDPVYLRMRDVMLPALRARGGAAAAPVLRLMAKAETDLGHDDLAFALVGEAKRAEGLTHDPGVNGRFVAALTGGLSKADYFGAPGDPSQVPVLIVGMPRSGSTLVEQMLAGHSEVAALGEAQFLRDVAVSAGFRDHDGAALVRIIKGMTADRAAALAGAYLARLPAGKARVVDKNLHNFELLGLFGRLFPKGRILHVVRDPLDTCVSCHLEPLGAWHSYAQDLGGLGRYYGQYRQVMDHWRKVLPNPMLEVRYEDVVADFEREARQVTAFLGLTWEAGVLDFRSVGRRAETLSVWQVRQPVYGSSVGRWRRVAGLLGPLKAELARFYPDGFGD
jgi:Tfp pilus assembly protein PilF